MKSNGARAVYWIVGCALAVLFTCLCVLILMAGSLFLIAGRMDPIYRPPTALLDSGKPETNHLDIKPGPILDIPPSASMNSFEMLDRLARTEVPVADPVQLSMQYFGISLPPRTLNPDNETFQVGKISPFWITDTGTQKKFAIYARLAIVGEHTYFWVDTSVDYDLDQAHELVGTFDQQIYPLTREVFGSEWSPGVDGDERIHILYASGLGQGVAGYYSSVDEYVPQVFEYSNGHEMFYLNADAVRLNSDFTYGVLAHEFVHMILWNVDANEQTWMNEGFAEIGAMLNGYAVGGVDLAYLNNPDLTLSYWAPGSVTNAENYGQAYLFLAYFLDRFGLNAIQDLFHSTADGLNSMDDVLQSLPEFSEFPDSRSPADEVYKDWAVALLLQDSDLSDGRFAFSTSGNRSPITSVVEEFKGCPIEEAHRQVNQYGIDYVRFECDGEYLLSFDGMSFVPLVPTVAHSGKYALWSNRGDESDMSVTKEFDLQGVPGPIALSYWTWYDLEEDYDYLYVEVSKDRGDSWEILKTPSGSDYDPSGNSYGWAYNGKSGGGFEPVWIQELVDLSEYQEEKILIRFEYITDAAVNGEGFLLDDIEIEAIGYREDFENGMGRWEPRGFVHLYNLIPQTYQLVLVERGSNTKVYEIELDEKQSAEFHVSMGDDVQDLTMIVIGTSRYTWQPASYQFNLEAIE